LRRTLEPEIAMRSCPLLTDQDLDSLGAQAKGLADIKQGLGDIYDGHHEFHLALLAPAASTWDTRVLTTLWRAGERYIRIGFGQFDDDATELERRATAHVALVNAFRTTVPEKAAAAVEEHLARNEQIALTALSGSSPAKAPREYGRRSTVRRGRRVAIGTVAREAERGERAHREVLVVIEMSENGLCRGVGITPPEHRDQLRVRPAAAGVLVRVRVKQAEPDADVPLGGAPQGGKHPDVPRRRRRPQQREMELVMAVVDRLHAQALLAELVRLTGQPVKLFGGDQQARTPREVRFQ
jgi:hypothetical protein